MTEAPPTRRRILIDTRPLRHAPFRRLWMSTIVTSVGSQFTVVAVPVQIYDITKSSAWVGVASATGLVPLIVFALWGGAIADTVDRRKLLLFTNSGLALLMVLFWVQALLGVDSIGLILVLVGIQAALFGMNMPARTASVARLVPAAELPAAVALNSTVMMAGGIAGPLLVGSLIRYTGIPVLYLVDALALCGALWAVWRLPALPPLNGDMRRIAGLRDVFAGFSYITANRILMVSFAADIIAMVFGFPRALFPELAEHGYPGVGEGPALSLLFAAIPIGSLIGGLLSGVFSRIERHGLMVILSVAAWGAAIVGFGLSPNIYLAAAFLAVAGAADMVSMVFRGTILQQAATDDMRGRMQGVHTVVVTGGPRVADLLHGVAAPIVTASVAVAAGGGFVVVLVLLLALAVPAFVRYRGAARG